MGLVAQLKKGDVIQIGILRITVTSNRAGLNIEAPKEVKINITKSKVQDVPKIEADK
jgi:sRNA-binding carbon storage regulator CsrA